LLHLIGHIAPGIEVFGERPDIDCPEEFLQNPDGFAFKRTMKKQVLPPASGGCRYISLINCSNFPPS